MRDILVFDCSGSMTGGFSGKSPLEKLLDHVVATYPPDTPWLCVAMRKLHRGRLHDAKDVLRIRGGPSEILEGMDLAFAPGTRPVLCTDDGDDLASVAELASGREMGVIMACYDPGGVRRNTDRRLGHVTYI